MIEQARKNATQAQLLTAARQAFAGDPVAQELHGQTSPIVVIGHGRYCQINTAAMVLGTTRKAIEHKIAKGVWVRGKHFRKAPDTGSDPSPRPSPQF